MLAVGALRHAQLFWLKRQGQHPLRLGCSRVQGERHVQSSPGPLTRRTGGVREQTVCKQDTTKYFFLWENTEEGAPGSAFKDITIKKEKKRKEIPLRHVHNQGSNVIFKSMHCDQQGPFSSRTQRAILLGVNLLVNKLKMPRDVQSKCTQD